MIIFEELMMQQESEQKQNTLDLQQEVEQLEEELEEELKLTKVLKYALDGPCGPCLSSQTHLPFKIKELLTELATVEEQIMWLESKVHNLKLSLYLEKKHTREWELQQLKNLHPHPQRQRRPPSLRRQQNRLKSMDNHELQDNDTQKRRSSFCSTIDTKHAKLKLSVLDTEVASRGVNNHTKNPNKLSEDLIKSLIGILLQMNQPFFFNNNGSNSDPYAILLDLDGEIRDIGPYNTFTQITRNALDRTRISECSIEAEKVRILMQRLCSVNLNLLTYKQKLAFWINIYNACIMNVL